MNLTKVRELVERWLEEKVEIDNGDVTTSHNGSVNLIKWLKGRKGHKDGVPSYKFGSAMKQIGFEQEHGDSGWFCPGIRLKGD